MSGRKSKEFWLSKRADNKGNRPTSAHAGGQSIPDLLSNKQPTVDPHLDVQPVPDPRTSVLSTPNLQRIPDLYLGGQLVLKRTSSGLGVPVSLSSRHPTVDPHFGVQSTPDQRSSGPSTSNSQRISDPYPGAPHIRSSSQSTRNPRPRGPRTPYPRSSGQPTPDLRTSGQPTPNEQHFTDPSPAGQGILEPNSSGHPMNSGVYTITNVHHKRFVYLEDGNDKTPLRGHYDPEHRNARWQVKRWVDGEYSIENVGHSRYANCESRPRLEAFVEGHHDRRLWRIQESLVGGEYTIAAIENENLWKLPDNGEDTPVTFSKVSTDPMCRWTFESAETVAPVNENPISLPLVTNTGLPLAPSGGRPMPDAAIVEFTSVIAEAADLLPPLVAGCEALRVVLQRADSLGHVNEERKALVKRLKFHLATVENDTAKLEEDQKIDETIPTLNQDVREPLETYARELKGIYEMLSGNQPKNSSRVGEVTSKTRKIEEIFQAYTIALHRFAASTVDQMRQQLERFQQESEKAHAVAQKARPTRPNAYGIQHRECLRGTRKKTLLAIGDWVDDESTEKWIFFFLDVAGSGKSTVAKHMAEKWNREDRLLARFFFSRDTTETMSMNSFCSTVAGAFADLDRNYKRHMDKFMARPNVELLSFEERFEGLVAGPLRAIGRHAILIIDALDECHPEQRDQLLQTLRDQHISTPFLRILATGRPERDIKRWANDEFGFGYTNFFLLEKGDKDVELYIKHTLKDLPIVQDRLYPVIRRAEGLFIWARVACDLLMDCDDIDGLLEELGKEVSLDYLYRVALQQSMPKEGASRRAMILVLQMILAAKEPLSIAELEMLSPKRDVVEKVVTRLGSVLLYQGREDPIRLLHTTFREFLTTRSKANMFFIHPEIGHHTLALGCLTTISDLSKQGQSGSRELDAISRREEVSFEQDTY